MLVENKFIFISLPRRASTSFMLSCLQSKLNLKFHNNIERKLKFIYENESYLNDLNFLQRNNWIQNLHTPYSMLLDKFGDGYPFIAVKRDFSEVFISLYNQILKEMQNFMEINVVNKLINLKIDDILFFKTVDILDTESRKNTAELFLKRNEINKNLFNEKYNFLVLQAFIELLFTPNSELIYPFKNIIWFDFDKLYELENWVSEKLNMDFKLIRFNESVIKNENLKINDYFIKKYNLIYEDLNNIKYKKSII